MLDQSTDSDWPEATARLPMSKTSARMRRSPRVVPSLLAAAAAIAVAGPLSGCDDNQNSTPDAPAVKARCVDQNGNVLPDTACVATPSGSAGGAHAIWVYGGSGGDTVGSRATGYTTTAPAEGEISTSSGHVVRGGFGGEGAAHGAAGESGGEGGHGGGGGGE